MPNPRKLPALPSAALRIRHAAVVDPVARTVHGDQRVDVVDGVITGLGSDDGTPMAVDDIDATGLYAVPGLIDCHVHLALPSADEYAVTGMAASYVGISAGRELGRTLARGFTTVRDAGGADHGVPAALAEGLVRGPRVFICGHALSPSGGHGDLRPPGRVAVDGGPGVPGIGRIVDGVDAVRAAVREEVRHGASHIKLMLSGGISSPTDRIDSLQFADDEIRAAVDEAGRHGLGCSAHAYTSASIRRGVSLGVRSVEHGNLLDASAAAAMAEAGTFLVPTLVTYVALDEQCAEQGLPPTSVAKIGAVRRAGEEALERAAEAGVRVAFGTDLLGDMRDRQSEEFRIRGCLRDSWEVLASATTVGAALLSMDGVLGVIAQGAAADLILVTANPGDDVTVLAEPQRNIRAVITAGRMVVDRMASPHHAGPVP